ncbi:hypothetical protein WQ54_27200 [Bacillus sp. SA1-12]|uniref:SH3 domain-containing protein n=1 Tax=Bacillus sp. SA1-12 TaxID=1455638 RepID=UPI0006367199|nr:SH3 domain-containing protein [Bacillus sp. SA1-12]KKI89249.1 hypothetical protein WQ54_27200 [Bacillus sp. SA1-12]
MLNMISLPLEHLSILPITQQKLSPYINERKTTTPKVNVLDEAVVKVKKGSVFNGWSRIEYNGIKGYAPYSYITKEKPGFFIYYANKSTNIYSANTTNSSRLGTLSKNEPVKIQIGGINNGWAIVSDFKGEPGYIKAADIVNKPYYYARESLVLRSQKSTNAKSILTIPQGKRGCCP